MIKGIPPSERKLSRETEATQPKADTVSQKASEQFSSLLHKKKRSELKELSKSKKKINQSLDKIENKLAKQVGEAKVTERQPSTKQRQPSTKQRQPTTKQRQPTQINKIASSTEQTDRQPPVATDKNTLATHQKSATHKQESVANEDLPKSLDAFDIASLIAQNQPPVQNAAAVAKATPTPPTDLNSIVGEIADRILVSSPADNPTATQEIRIHLKESVLPNTEVRIYRHAGRLQVEFVTTSKDSQMFIEQKQSDIQKVLGERLTDETVNVSVQDSRQTRGGEEQGRSRQQYVYPDQEDDN